MKTLVYNNREYGPVAESYNELSGKQLIALMKMFSSSLEKDSAELITLKILLNKTFLKYFLIPVDARDGMMEHIQWVFEGNTLTEQLLPSYRKFRLPWYKSFVGPKKEFDNLTLGEFHHTELAYYEYTQEDNEDALNDLVAIMYRQPVKDYNYKLDSSGDARHKFNPNEISYYSKQIRRWPLKVKLAILWYYDGCRQYLLKEYDEVYQGNSGDDSEGMFGVIRGLSGPVYGPIEKVEELNIHTAHLEMIKQNKEAEAITKS